MIHFDHELQIINKKDVYQSRIKNTEKELMYFIKFKGNKLETQMYIFLSVSQLGLLGY